VELRRPDVNGQPGVVVAGSGGRPVAVWALDVAEGRIQSLSSVVNPDKLRHLGPV
jgi:RNA polymerase sigma-70 factor, ECF subfamily